MSLLDQTGPCFDRKFNEIVVHYKILMIALKGSHAGSAKEAIVPTANTSIRKPKFIR